MIVAPTASREGQPEQLSEPGKSGWSLLWQRVALCCIMLVSIFMNFYQLGQNGFANLYYAAAIKSMLDSWHNFFFVSFDPGGFVTIDKPPLGFWLQAASAKVFGFTPFSIFFPQALAGVLAVLLLYTLICRHFGVTAGLLAALALAISPISVVTNRNNTIDSTLVLVMLLGAWAVMRAAETGKLRWLLLCAVFVGLGFNIKMLEAYLVVPAYGLLYLLAAPRRFWVRIGHLALAALLLLAISLSWALAVDLTPSSQRPYVGSSQDNSEISLALGYNGIQRLLGSFGFGGGNRGNGSSQTLLAGLQGGSFNGDFPQPGPDNSGQPPQGFAGGPGQLPQGFPGGSGGGMFNTGMPSLLRLFNEPLGGQIVWLLPLALLGMLALAWQRRLRLSGEGLREERQQRSRHHLLTLVQQTSLRFRENRQQQALIVWGIWLLTMAIFFSAANFFHQYYLSTLAPAICALFGIGVVVMWNDYRRSGWRGWLLPLALLLTALEQIHIIMSNPSWGTWLIPLIAIPCALAAIILFAARLMPRLRINARMLLPAVGVALAALLLTSAIWSAVPGLENRADNLPTAGPSQQGAGGGPGGTGLSARAATGLPFERLNQRNIGGNGGNANTALIRYLEANRGGAKYLVAVASANEAESLILATNQPIMALGGFSGGDPILTTSQLATLVGNGTVRFFLLNGSGGGPGGSRQSSLTSWITQHCTAVASSQWQSTSTNSNAGGFGGASQLYACQATASPPSPKSEKPETFLVSHS